MASYRFKQLHVFQNCSTDGMAQNVSRVHAEQSEFINLSGQFPYIVLINVQGDPKISQCISVK